MLVAILRKYSFNPLDRGNLNQIYGRDELFISVSKQQTFQSPRSGKFESNRTKQITKKVNGEEVFQSPRSGKFESNILRYSAR